MYGVVDVVAAYSENPPAGTDYKSAADVYSVKSADDYCYSSVASTG